MLELGIYDESELVCLELVEKLLEFGRNQACLISI